jgi:hypothetical protein
MNTLTPDEEKRLRELDDLRHVAEAKFYKLRHTASSAVKARNAQARLLDKIRSEWLPLAERKYQR